MIETAKDVLEDILQTEVRVFEYEGEGYCIKWVQKGRTFYVEGKTLAKTMKRAVFLHQKLQVCPYDLPPLTCVDWRVEIQTLWNKLCARLRPCSRP